MTYAIAQDALTIAATGVLYTAIAYTAAGILHQIWKKPTPQPIPSIATVEQPAEPEPIPAPQEEDAWSAPTPALPAIAIPPTVFALRPLPLALPPAEIAPVTQAITPTKRKRGRPRKNAA